MNRPAVLLAILLFVGVSSVSITIRQVKGVSEIYIRADGSIDPPTAPITSLDNITYILTANITSEVDGITIERDNIVLDGAGYTIQGIDIPLAGIDVSARTNVTIMNIKIRYFDSAIWLSSSTNCTIVGVDASYNVDGIYLRGGSSHCTVTENIATGTWGEGIMISQSSFNFVSRNNASDNLYGINLSGSSNNTITENNVADNGYGIRIGGYNNTVLENNATHNDIGISSSYGSGNNISKNSLTANEIGLSLHSSSNEIIRGNVFVDDGLSVYNSYTNIVENNSVNSKPLVYLEAVSNHTVENDAGQVILVECDRMLVENLDIAHTDWGIVLWKTCNTKIRNNTIADSLGGVEIEGRGYPTLNNNNSIQGNNFVNNEWGISLASSLNNSVNHNNFLNNTQQVSIFRSIIVWDDGYPSGGNYWSDYNGTDIQCGYYQNLSGNDGLGDTPHSIDSGNLDNYPLMEPFSWAPNDVAVKAVTRPKHVIGSGDIIQMNVTVMNQGAYAENFNVTLYANSTIIEKGEVVLSSGDSTTLAMIWNTSSFVYGSYTIWAYAEPVPDEEYIVDNTYISRVVILTIPGDVDGDGSVGIFDIVSMADVYGSQEGDPDYDPNCDVDGDGDVDIFDIVTAVGNYGDSW